MKHFIFCSLLMLFFTTYGIQADDNYIYVGCMDMAKNLNPYLAQSEIELALQQLVFPPLIADFGSNQKGDKSFLGILIDDSNIQYEPGYYLDFGLSESPVFKNIKINPDDIVDNVTRIHALGEISDFSFNLVNAETLSPQSVRITFGTKNIMSKLFASTFPIVNLSSIKKNGWNNNSKTFIFSADKNSLIGYSDYNYENIFTDQNTITLAPVKSEYTKESPKLSLKTFPDYSQLINGLRRDEIQCAFNISALTEINSKDIAWADMQFGRQSISYLEVTERGEQKGLSNMAIIDNIRNRFRTFFQAQELLRSSGWVYRFDGILNESISFTSGSNSSRVASDTISILYVNTTINDKIIKILSQVFKDMGYTLYEKAMDRNLGESKININDFDLIMESRFINTPEFLNLKFYYNYKRVDNQHKAQIKELLSMSGDMSILNDKAQELESRILRQLPIVFLVRYHTRIAYRTKELGRNINDSRGASHFFHNLSSWRRNRCGF